MSANFHNFGGSKFVLIAVIICFKLVSSVHHSQSDFKDDNAWRHKNCLHEIELDPKEIVDAEEKSVFKTYVRTSYVNSPVLLNCDITNTPQVIKPKRVRRHRPEFANQDDCASLENDSSKSSEEFREEDVWALPHASTSEQVRTSQARKMKKYMNTSVDPCDDFYLYACGNWGKYNKMPKDKVAYDTFEILREGLDVALKELLMDDLADRPLPLVTGEDLFKNKLRHIAQFRQRFFRRRRALSSMYNIKKEEPSDFNNAEMKAKSLYKSCMNYELIEKRGIQPLLDLLEKLGGWPVLDPNWSEANFDWLLLTAHLRKFNNDILIVQWVGPDIQHSDENIIQFDQTTLGLPTRDYYLKQVNQVYLFAYKKFMSSVIHLMGATIKQAEEAADEIVEFETSLSKITSAPEDRTNISLLYKKMTLQELHNEIPQIDWQIFLSIVQNREVDLSEKVIMFAKYYMHDLVDLISETEQKTVANYLLWRFVRHRINNLDHRFQEVKQKFYLELFGREKSPPRWKNCVTQVNSNMGFAVGALFIKKYFDENSKKETLQMTRELQHSFQLILKGSDWIDFSTRNLAEQKVESMSLKIGYPDFILSTKSLDERYENLHISADKYFENTLNVLLYLSIEEQKKLGQNVNKTVWNTAPATVNAYYSRNKNQIMFPAGILQPPFYHRFFPKSLNYAGIGIVIGHELTHSLDDKGRLFDKNGNLNKWWTDSAIKTFHEKAKCLIHQYNNYTLSDIGTSIDGENTQGENIADGGGIKQSYMAYQRWKISNQNKPKVMEREILPGINLTSSQLFFLNFAQVWCGDMRRQASKNKLKTAVHSPAKFRVIGTLSNLKEFSNEFHCPVGSPMNPEKKCNVW